MTIDRLKSLEKLNQLELSDAEREEVMAFFETLNAGENALSALNTDNTERMVHVINLVNVLRDDAEIKNFSRESLLEGAPEQTDGYWQVPRLIE